MKFCSKCGKELVDEAIVCPNCGCAVAVTQKQITQQRSKKSRVMGAIFGGIGGGLAALLACLLVLGEL